MANKTDKEKIDKEKEEKSKAIVVTFRIFQAICFGMFALGLSMGLGDYGKFVGLPFSQISITTTVFGLVGSIITEILSKNAEKW